MLRNLAVGAPLVLAASVAIWVACVGPDLVDERTDAMYSAQQDRLALQGAQAVATRLQAVAEVLEGPHLRRQAGLDVAKTDEEVAAALALFHSPVLERLGALVFVHDEGGEVHGAGPNLDPAMKERFHGHRHSPEHGDWHEHDGAGLCTKCFVMMNKVSVTSPLGDGRYLAANIDASVLARQALEPLVDGDGGGAWLEDATGTHVDGVGTDETDTAGWLRAQAEVVGPGSGWRVHVVQDIEAAGAAVRGAADRLLLGAAGGALLIVLAGLNLVMVYRSGAKAKVRMVRSLAHQEKLATLGGLTAQVGHELRNALFCLQGNLDIVGMSEPGTEDFEECMEAATDASGRLGEIVDGLRLYSRRDDDQRVAARLSDTAADAATLLKPTIKGTNIEMELNLSAGGRSLQGKGQITQVIVNLVRNACDALERTVGARVVVSVAELNGFAELRVDDNGPGIPPDVFARLFEPFFTTKGEDGTGLGLSVCSGIAQDHGGELVAGESPLGGARFTLRIPLCDAPEPGTGDLVAPQVALLG